MLFDKTGTLTQGRPVLADVDHRRRRFDADEVLRLAASLDQVSPHVLASAIVTGGTRRGLALQMPDERPGGARLRPGGDRRRRTGCRLGKASWIVGDDHAARGSVRCAGAPTWTAR